MGYFRAKTIPEENQLLGHGTFADLTLHKINIFSVFHNNKYQEENTLTDHLLKFCALFCQQKMIHTH